MLSAAEHILGFFRDIGGLKKEKKMASGSILFLVGFINIIEIIITIILLYVLC